MTKTQDFTKAFFTLMFFWVLLNGNLAFDTLLIGMLASAIILLFLHESLCFLSEARATPKALIAAVQYLGYFLKELVKSNIALAGVVLSPELLINPGIVKVRTKLKSRVGRLLLANSITLTPGTLTVELEGEWLYIHWVNIESTDIEAATQSIVSGFEQYLEVIYG